MDVMEERQSPETVIKDKLVGYYTSQQSGLDKDHVPNNGTSSAEMIGLMLIEPSVTLLMSIFSYLCLSFNYNTGFFPGPSQSRLSFLVHAVAVNTLFLLVSTVWNKYIFFVVMVVALMVLFFAYLGWLMSILLSRQIQPFSWKTFLNLEIELKNRLPYLDDFRGHLLQMTAISILAVDFDIFPVRFSKTDMYGWSIMDAGVGMFVGAHGICSSEARGKPSESLHKSVWSSVPLLILGFVRLIVTTAVGYHQVTPEYGIHWNFFFTLAFTKLICSALSFCFPNSDRIYFAMSVGILHQWLLSGYGVTEYILREERFTFFDANKEGICSLLGFVFIYYGSVEIGKLLWKPMSKVKDYISILSKLISVWLIGWMVAHVFHVSVQPTSRRMANVPYCVWAMAFMCLHIAVHLAQQLFLAFYSVLTKASPANTVTMHSYTLWKATNYNGLFYFLLSNVLTGVVNLSMKTSEASAPISLLVLSTYVFILTAIVTIMYNKSIQIKFW